MEIGSRLLASFVAVNGIYKYKDLKTSECTDVESMLFVTRIIAKTPPHAMQRSVY